MKTKLISILRKLFLALPGLMLVVTLAAFGAFGSSDATPILDESLDTPTPSRPSPDFPTTVTARNDAVVALGPTPVEFSYAVGTTLAGRRATAAYRRAAATATDIGDAYQLDVDAGVALGYVNISPRNLAALDPDVILTVTTASPSLSGVLADNPELAPLVAVEQGHLVELGPGIALQSPGPRVLNCSTQRRHRCLPPASFHYFERTFTSWKNSTIDTVETRRSITTNRPFMEPSSDGFPLGSRNRLRPCRPGYLDHASAPVVGHRVHRHVRRLRRQSCSRRSAVFGRSHECSPVAGRIYDYRSGRRIPRPR